MAAMEPSLIKLVIGAVVIWFVWRWLGRLNASSQARRSEGPSNRQAPNQQARNPARNERAVEDMVKCPKCGAYVPAKGGHDCSKA